MAAIFTVYLTGAAGNSIALFYVGHGIVEGIDVGGMRYKGSYTQASTNDPLVGVVKFVVPASMSLITGLTAGSSPLEIPVQISLPHNFDNGEVVRIETPTGPVNARFELMSEVP